MALAGFASLVAVFRRGPEDILAPRAWAGLRFMIELSLTAVMFAILPFCLAATGMPEGPLWIVSCLALAGGYVWLLERNVARSRAISAAGRPHRQPLQAVSGLVLGGAAVALLLLSAADVLVARGPSVYLAALFLLLLGVANQFLNFVATTRPGRSGSG